MAGVAEKFSPNLPTPHLILARSLTYRALPPLDSSNDLNVRDKFDSCLRNHSGVSLAPAKIYPESSKRNTRARTSKSR